MRRANKRNSKSEEKPDGDKRETECVGVSERASE